MDEWEKKQNKKRQEEIKKAKQKQCIYSVRITKASKKIVKVNASHPDQALKKATKHYYDYYTDEGTMPKLSVEFEIINLKNKNKFIKSLEDV